MKIALEITPNLEPLFGTRDENLRLMEDSLGVRIDLRSDAVHVEGPEAAVERVRQIFADFEALRRRASTPTTANSTDCCAWWSPIRPSRCESLADSGKQRSAGVKRTVQPRSINQRKYVEAIEQNDMVFGVGPAGTGKTYLAVAMAVAALNAKKVSRIVLVRPAVEAGERLGFLPGTLQDKVDPYLRPLYDALYDLLDPEKVDKMLEKNVIEVAPLAFMRGRTLNDAFIIMDEAQNTTIEQMKMFLTRMGNNSKAVITGDITQIDLPNPRKSGLLDAINILDGVEGIHFCHFEDCDVVRHALVQRIVRAYESVKSQQQELPLALGEAIEVGASSPAKIARSPAAASGQAAIKQLGAPGQDFRTWNLWMQTLQERRRCSNERRATARNPSTPWASLQSRRMTVHSLRSLCFGHQMIPARDSVSILAGFHRNPPIPPRQEVWIPAQAAPAIPPPSRYHGEKERRR